MKEPLFIYGSENPKYPSKLHLCDDDGKTLCGVDGYWMEATNDVRNVEDKGETIYVSAHLRQSDGSYLSEKSLLWDFAACKRCKKKLKQMYK